MAKTKREFILATCFLYGTAAILSFVSLGTQNWVEGKAQYINNSDSGGESQSNIKYGLFSGTFQAKYGVIATFEITTTCLLSENVCALLCGKNSDSRYNQLKKLYRNEPVSFDTDCPQILHTSNMGPGFFRRFNALGTTLHASSSNKKFLNCGIWVSSIVFLCLSACFGVLLAGLAVWNTASNPIEVYFSIYGMYIYNAIAFFCSLLVCVLWAAMHLSITFYNIAIFYTLDGTMSSKGKSNLGYSYWLNVGALFCYIITICILFTRDYLISKEPTTKINIDEASDPAIYLY